MARRSDHSRPELRELILVEGHRQMEAAGFARFSAREVAKRIGYSIGTLYNVFGSYDRLVLAINARTVRLWAVHLREQLDACHGDRIECLVRSYFAFAQSHQNAWAAIYDHRLPPDDPAPDWYVEALGELTGIMVAEVAAVMPEARRAEAPALARSLLAVVHGHCVFSMTGTFALLGEATPAEAALARVREGLAAATTG
jgi:AcrR family transcriptional regulator